MNQSEKNIKKRLTAVDWYREQMESIRKQIVKINAEFDAKLAAELQESGEGGPAVVPGFVWNRQERGKRCEQN